MKPRQTPPKAKSEKREHPAEKQDLHPRNRHRTRYNFEALVQSLPELKPYVYTNPFGDRSIHFDDPAAVLHLNRALLKHHYGIAFWKIPEGYLCPPIPGRADYLHNLADLLAEQHGGAVPRGSGIRVLDIGTGANAIYPLIGHAEYGWSFLGSDTDAGAIASAVNIVKQNAGLETAIHFVLQKNPLHIFKGIVAAEDRFDLSMCNPPFHASEAEALSGTERKRKNLNLSNKSKTVLNFGGQAHELWTEGGEIRFIQTMVKESATFAGNCFWFTSLVSKQAHLPEILNTIAAAGATDVKQMNMGQGQKTSRFVAWTFLSRAQQADWIRKRKLQLHFTR